MLNMGTDSKWKEDENSGLLKARNPRPSGGKHNVLER